jgi:hypothetical protein
VPAFEFIKRDLNLMSLRAPADEGCSRISVPARLMEIFDSSNVAFSGGYGHVGGVPGKAETFTAGLAL